MGTFDTAPERLALLLPWLNESPAESAVDILATLRRFVTAFDGSVASGHVEVVTSGTNREEWRPDWLPRHRPRWEQRTTQNDLMSLHIGLSDLLRKGFPQESGYESPLGAWVHELPTLRFGVRGANRQRPSKLSRATRSERRAYGASGAYTLLVDGALGDLVLYLAAHLLTMPGAVAVTRCPAPAPYSAARCGRFLITSGKGRPRAFCSEACRQRRHAERLQEQQDRIVSRKKTRRK